MPTAKKTTASGKKTQTKFEAGDVEDNKIIASLSYIFILCLAPLMLKRKSEFAQFHARQGLTIAVAWFVFWVIGIIPVLGWLISFLGNLALLVISIMGVIKTLDGQTWKIPYIYEWSKKWNL
ncbi:hypothetical protein COU00_03555 [Candidatus Falkowbacteria bacterium CG10_big_fil_rev_8_21_14_0_10_43_11]|uniref:DUF4870 domain-containing protein n=1 Tax=Candidatus Falkowbacteria bacterium CG10_big_fil_rev_8_21_14_0_10_43_11 TaxID=1974568 RepID=A0A2M6WLE7_9BACT|nr:MAG: hypothetical protein COU00_03555 [Candidatus Falkowbacteria bacterium CG10_big_fil_rev_8_21_14_0_10_43_11]